MSDLTNEMAGARCGWTSALLREWSTPERLRDALAAAMEHEADRVGNADFGATFRDHVETVDVRDPLAWANRRIDLGNGEWCVTGIRYRGLDVTKPFVDIVATSVPPTADAIADLVRQVLPGYAEFAPRAVRVDVADPDRTIAEVRGHPGFTGASVDLYIVAGLVSDLLALPPRPGLERVELVPAGLEEAARAEEEYYTQIRELRPDLPLWATPSSHDELEESHEQGLLFRLLVDGAPAGVIAARRDDDHAMTGFAMQQIVVDPRHLGQRLAAPAQQRLARELPAQEGDTLWGSIHPDNQPSLRNALSLGRRVVGAYVWLTPTGLTGL